jgi:hypothetical protein
VPVIGRAQREQQQGRKPGDRTADAPPEPPGDGETDDADKRAEQPPRLEQLERNELVEQRRGHVEAAAIHVEVGEGQGADVLETGRVHLQQEIGVFGMGVVVPAEAVILKRQAGDDHNRAENDPGEVVTQKFDRAPLRRLNGGSRDR